MKEKAVYLPPTVNWVAYFVEQGFVGTDMTAYTPGMGELESADPVNGGDWIDGSDDETFGSIF